jgi:hypothetical protein
VEDFLKFPGFWWSLKNMLMKMMKIDEQNDEEDEYEIFLSFFYKKD